MRAVQFLIASLVALIPSNLLGQDLGVFKGKPSEFEDYGYLVRGAVWLFPPGEDREIFVCWENPTPANETARSWVRDQIETTWQRFTAVRFKGWDKCGIANSGIHILWSDEGPHVKKFGRQLDKLKSGMVLNNEFNAWSPTCKTMIEKCIRSIAVHEFGHALGFAHEQNRPDTPGECSRVYGQNQAAEIMLTPYDPHSVMNYCNDKYNNDGALSPWDIRAAQAIYGRPRS